MFDTLATSRILMTIICTGIFNEYCTASWLGSSDSLFDPLIELLERGGIQLCLIAIKSDFFNACLAALVINTML